MSEETLGSGCLLLTPAAKAARMSRGTFHRQYQKRIVPPPTLRKPRNRWSEDQINRWRHGELQSDPNTGIWYERDREQQTWRKLPNQYVTHLPQDAA